MTTAGAPSGTSRLPAVRLVVVVGEEDHVGHRPLATELVHRAHAAGLAGATVHRGVEGFGAGSRVHTNRVLSLSEELPLAVSVVDVPERVEAFLPVVGELLAAASAGGLVTLEDVTVVRFVGGHGGPADRGGRDAAGGAGGAGGDAGGAA